MHVTFAPLANSCIALPPGAEHKSSTSLLFTSPNIFTGIVAPESCTHHLPSLKPSISFTLPGFFNLKLPGSVFCN